ncbi:4-hydroxy-3-methylbut-2-enyl diphosphate reductase [Adlercreutzia sp. ZJ242]|uniref:4-hydroxy-3-methylbut-2-enyl diphosphate reductase n=1 Tax=Adlercreutzia sp. ZJ242 TaxID=2709409 RepID=UPI0013ECF84D|nr:4-hydroxy-3-methylbut-2-enyl diphosphate reductase [Adlercreutzia sp. ZJ242]
MQVIQAKHAGACYGVQRALDMAMAVVERGGEVATLGPLIHNPKVVADLEARGARVAEAPADIHGGTVIIRSHGVTPEVRAELEERGLDIVDATCPHVARAQAAAAEIAGAGCRVMVVGEAGHPEVEGLTACAQAAGGKVDVVAAPADVPEGLYDPIGVVVQTTQVRDNLDAVVAALEEQGLSPIVKNTICSATSQRQRTAADVADRVDAMVVIGGRNSSNTTRLAEICAERCVRTFHVESAGELAPEQFAGCAAVGVTAGASTPEDQIQAVVAFLEEL